MNTNDNICKTIKVSELIAQALEQLEIKHVFGIIGAGNVHLFEAISRRGYTEIICVHHEQAACMAMQTYYRTSGKLSASLLTTGAGSTNGVTGVVSAWADSIPCIVIAGNENSKFTKPDNPLRMWGVQGYDSVDMVRKVTKYAQRVTSPEQAVYEVQKAAYIALDQRPGPCWIEIPMDIQASRIDPATSTQFAAPQPVNYLTPQLSAQVDSVVEALVAAQRPLLWLGHGIRLAGAEKNRATARFARHTIPGIMGRNRHDRFQASSCIRACRRLRAACRQLYFTELRLLANDRHTSGDPASRL